MWLQYSNADNIITQTTDSSVVKIYIRVHFLLFSNSAKVKHDAFTVRY